MCSYRTPPLTKKNHHHAEETSSEREKQTLRGQRTRAFFDEPILLCRRIDRGYRFHRSREWMRCALHFFARKMKPETEKMRTGFGSADVRERRDVLYPINASKTDSIDIFSSPRTQVKRVFCESSGALVPKDKAVKRFIVRNMVESAAIRDLQEACAYETYTLPKMYRKVHYSISAAIHSKVVRVRSREARRIREPPRRAPRRQEK